MALIKCPECENNISDKANICIHCGFPINEYLQEKLLEEEKVKENEKIKEQYFCNICGKQNEVGEDYCIFCDNRLTPYYKMSNSSVSSENMETKEFKGIYKYTLFGKKQEVYCIRCGSENCSYYQEQQLSPRKTKTRYTVNLNPLKPFTFANKKEKVIREEKLYTVSKFLCNDCGKIFD